ncbi:MAG: 12-oxophytodienoate reductase [Caldilineae bacterium]|nr:12-oxophytodienoate reductase [Chloroflexota bacterium]MCB9177428.1 12-oxophytodienoate reductase [Caldilineae bacterium]
MPDPQLARLFQPVQLGDLRLRNRVVMAPMTRRFAAEDGIATPETVRYYARRAEAEVGLILSEGTHVDARHAPDTLTVPRFETPDQIAAWRRVVDAVHAAGGAFAPQLWHTGRRALDPIGPSAHQPPPGRDGRPRPAVRAMDAEDFAQVTEAFRHAAAQARAIRCDALEIHGAHGYLLDSFLSPQTNRRDDAYGGSAQNRMRFPLEIVAAVREAVGPDFPIIFRFSQWRMDDYGEAKWRSPGELGAFLGALSRAGADILHVSTRSVLDPGFPDAHPTRGLAAWSKALSGLPVIAVGKVSVTLAMDESYGEAASLVTDPWPAIALVERGEVDLLAVGRALIANPDWVPLVRSGRWQDLKPYHKDLLRSLE